MTTINDRIAGGKAGLKTGNAAFNKTRHAFFGTGLKLFDGLVKVK